jgi:hypothetical protein
MIETQLNRTLTLTPVPTPILMLMLMLMLMLIHQHRNITVIYWGVKEEIETEIETGIERKTKIEKGVRVVV